MDVVIIGVGGVTITASSSIGMDDRLIFCSRKG